ncbi:MAG: hypothetical protein QM683_09360 [Lacrimispora sp.]
MNCFKKSSFVISGARLQSSKDNHFNIRLKGRCFQIIRGTVYNQNQEPCAGAAVQVIEINGEDHSRIPLGYAFTDENGYYLFSIEAKPSMKYELAVYAPLHPYKKEELY